MGTTCRGDNQADLDGRMMPMSNIFLELVLGGGELVAHEGSGSCKNWGACGRHSVENTMGWRSITIGGDGDRRELSKEVRNRVRIGGV